MVAVGVPAGTTSPPHATPRNPQLAREIEAKIREKAGVKGAAPVAAADKVEEPSVDKKVEHLPTRKRGGNG